MLSLIAKLVSSGVAKAKDSEDPGPLKKFMARDTVLAALPLARHAEAVGIKMHVPRRRQAVSSRMASP